MVNYSKKILWKYITIKREKKRLFIFPDKPFWFVGDESISDILSFFNNELIFDDLNNKLINQFEYDASEVLDVVDYLYQLLMDAGIYKCDDEKFNDPLKVKNAFALPVLNITKNCNLACKHCYADANYIEKDKIQDELTTVQWKKIIKDIVDVVSTRGEDRILLTGGEPFVRKDIIEIITYINSLGFRPLINTNSLLIKDEYIKKLKEYKAELLVSLDGSRADIHEYIRGKNTFNKTIERIMKLKEFNVITRLSFTVHEGNLNDIPSYIELAKKLGIEDLAINNLTVLSRATSTGLERVNQKDINNILKQIVESNADNYKYLTATDYAKQGAILLENIKFTYCGVGAASLCIDSNGDVYPCYNTMHERFKVGNVLVTSIKDLWDNSEILNKLRCLNVDSLNEKCKRCFIRYYCGGGCRGETYFLTGSIKSPYPFCKDMKDAIVDLMFYVSNENDVFSKRVEYFQKIKRKYVEEIKNGE